MLEIRIVKILIAYYQRHDWHQLGELLITLASMLKIPVNMHNVPEENIFKPNVWSAFGTEGLEDTDYRACSNYGLMYGK